MTITFFFTRDFAPYKGNLRPNSQSLTDHMILPDIHAMVAENLSHIHFIMKHVFLNRKRMASGINFEVKLWNWMKDHFRIFCKLTNKIHLSFSYFEFEIRLIILGLSFQKQTFLYWNSHSVRSHNQYIKEPTVSGRHRKAFYSLQSCWTGSS